MTPDELEELISEVERDTNPNGGEFRSTIDLVTWRIRDWHARVNKARPTPPVIPFDEKRRAYVVAKELRGGELPLPEYKTPEELARYVEAMVCSFWDWPSEIDAGRSHAELVFTIALGALRQMVHSTVKAVEVRLAMPSQRPPPLTGPSLPDPLPTRTSTDGAFVQQMAKTITIMRRAQAWLVEELTKARELADPSQLPLLVRGPIVEHLEPSRVAAENAMAACNGLLP